MIYRSDMAGILYVAATPIGNLDDLTPRVIDALGKADVVASERPEKTRIILDKNGISKKCIKYNEGNKTSAVPGIMALLRKGLAVAYVSEAGTPCISDPGFNLVRSAAEEGIHIVPLPGASAVITLLSASGLPTDRFTFMGFAPKKQGELARFAEELRAMEGTAVFYVSHRNLEKVIDALLAAGYDPQCAVGREMTKIHEEFVRGPLSAIRERLLTDPRGEYSIAVYNKIQKSETDTRGLVSNGRELMKKYSIKETSSILSVVYGLTKNRIYDILLKDKEK